MVAHLITLSERRERPGHQPHENTVQAALDVAWNSRVKTKSTRPVSTLEDIADRDGARGVGGLAAIH
jgi:hypothetical protein